MCWHRFTLLLLLLLWLRLFAIESVASYCRRVALARIFLFDLQSLRVAQLVQLSKFFEYLDFGDKENPNACQLTILTSRV